MTNFRSPLSQSLILVLISILFGFGGNFVRNDRISWLAEELDVLESIDTDSNQPELAAVSIDQAKLFYDEGTLFIDARDEVYYNEGHIKGAIKNSFLMELIFTIESIQSKETPIVVYCGDPGCGDSEDLAYDLKDSGFTRLYVFKGGWLEWSSKGYPSETSE